LSIYIKDIIIDLSFTRHASLKELDYFWRFEPGSEFICPIQFDPFEYMKKNNKQLSFSLSTHELEENLPSLYSTVMKFKAEHPQWKPASDPPEKSLLSGMVDKQGRYNRCYFWNNFQVKKKKNRGCILM
jgi:alpha 1,2-mannosyltransferase